MSNSLSLVVALESIARIDRELTIAVDQASTLAAHTYSAHRALGETNAERQVLARFVAQDAEANTAYLRLAELEVAAGAWPVVIQNAERSLAVDPLVPTPYHLLAEASQHTGNTNQVIQANRALLQLDPPNPAEVHFQLARALYGVGDPAARRQVLEALEEAPRYRAALGLLLDLNRAASQPETKAPPPVGSTP